MKYSILAAALIALAVVPGAAFAGPTDEMMSASARDANTVVCRTELVAGTRTKTETMCATKRKWNDVHREAVNRINDIQLRALTSLH